MIRTNTLGCNVFEFNALCKSRLSIKCKLAKYCLACFLIICSPAIQLQKSRCRVTAILRMRTLVQMKQGKLQLANVSSFSLEYPTKTKRSRVSCWWDSYNERIQVDFIAFGWAFLCHEEYIHYNKFENPKVFNQFHIYGYLKYCNED